MCRILQGLRLLTLLAALPGVADAAQTVFDYRVDRFEVSGQASFVDEFNDSLLSPWSIGAGTAVDTGLELSLRSPGVFMPSFWSFITSSPTAPGIEVSNTSLAVPAFQVSSGAGDFVTTSTWTTLPTAPPGSIGGFYSMSITMPGLPLPGECIHPPSATPAPVVVRTFTIALRDFNTVVAPYVGPAGLAMGLTENVVCVFDPLDQSKNEMDSHTPEATGVAGPVTGDLILRLSWNDVVGEMTPSYSVDGGASFQTPFAARPVSFTNASFQLLGGSVVVDSVPAMGFPGRLLLVVMIFAIVGLARSRSSSFRLAANCQQAEGERCG